MKCLGTCILRTRMSLTSLIVVIGVATGLLSMLPQPASAGSVGVQALHLNVQGLISTDQVM